MNDIYNIMSHQHDPADISGNLEESIPMIYPTLLIDYDHVNPIFLDHLPSPLEYHHHHDYFQHNNDHVDQRTTAVVVGDDAQDLSFWSGDDDNEKASAGTLESLVDQATRLVSTGPVSAITYYGGNINMINDDDMISTCFGYNPQQIITTMATTTTTMAVNDILVLTNDIHGLEIEHRSDKEKEAEEIYAINHEAVEIEHRRASLFTYAATTTSTQSSSVVPDHHTQREGSKKTESTTSCTNQRSKATHNKAERKRRNKMNQRMEALKRLVPNICHKTDKATILDQVIEYIKKLQNQRDQLRSLRMMSSYGMNNNMKHPMMIPMSYYIYMQQQQQQQQLHMTMMADDAQMGMGVDLGSMHTNPIMHPNMSSTSYWN